MLPPGRVVQHPAQFLLASDAPQLGQGRQRLDEFVLDPLVIESMPIAIDENREGFAEVFFAEEDKVA